MIKLDIFSGFLGAGKTYIIKKLIENNIYNESVAIIENEFGEVSIDALVLKDTNIKIKEINSGCICCEVTGDFKEAVLEVINNYHVERIIIEPSGVAKLSDILKVFKEKELKNAVKVDNVITVIDPNKFDLYINNFKDFYKDQIVNAKNIVISRSEKAKEELILDVKGKIRKINSSIKIIEGNLDSNLVEVVNKEKAVLKINENKNVKGKLGTVITSKAKDLFETFVIYPNNILSKSELNSKFKFISSSNIFGEVLRAKGVVKLNDGSFGQFDFVKDEFEIRKINSNEKSVISFIGTNLNKKDLEKFFN